MNSQRACKAPPSFAGKPRILSFPRVDLEAKRSKIFFLSLPRKPFLSSLSTMNSHGKTAPCPSDKIKKDRFQKYCQLSSFCSADYTTEHQSWGFCFIFLVFVTTPVLHSYFLCGKRDRHSDHSLYEDTYIAK